MYIESVPNRSSPPAILLRESFREGSRVRKRTLANLSDWPPNKIELFRKVLRDEPLCAPEDAFAIERSLPHGHVEAVLGTLRKIQLDSLIAPKRCRQRDLIVAMLVERLLHPGSKLAATRTWKNSTLADQLSVRDADEDELYAALDWLLARKGSIEKRLAARLLSEDSLVLYDISSSFYYGHCCPLARRGHDRDGKKGLPIIVYGVITDRSGCPVAVDIYPGNTGDPSTVPDQARKIREQFGLRHVVLVGDRGMLTQTKIDKLEQYPGLGWISSLRSEAICGLLDAGALKRSLFDEVNLAEISSPDFPGERLIACYNPILAEERHRKRQELLAATEKGLAKIAKEVKRRKGTPLSAGDIGLKTGRVIERYKMRKHFSLRIADGLFAYARTEDTIRQEEQLDGLYVIRTSEPVRTMSAEETVRNYKRLAHVERAFRCLKGLDLRVRPIFHHTEAHVRAHIFLCLLAYYVEWHMRQALSPLLFADEELERDRERRDPVATAEPSLSAKQKRTSKKTGDGLPAQSFKTLLEELATRCRNTCRVKSLPDQTVTILTNPTAVQRRALDLLKMYPVIGHPEIDLSSEAVKG